MNSALRYIVVVLAGLAAGCGMLLLVAFASPISTLLPEGETVACFATADTLGQRLWFGRPSAQDDSPAVVDHMRLKLTRYGEEEADAEHAVRRWHYSFGTTVKLREHGSWSDGGQCDWTDDRLSRVQFDLGCYQDCDGGGIWLYRLPFTRALVLDWNFLVMRPRGALSNRGRWPVLFRLHPVPASDCADKPDSVSPAD